MIDMFMGDKDCRDLFRGTPGSGKPGEDLAL
jgi:hypothetical protein